MAGLELTGLEGKVAVVTGAGRMRSIGRPIAVEMAKAGADIVLTGTGRKPENYPDDEKAAGWRDIDSVADEVRATGRRALPLVSDVADEGSVRELLETVLREFGRVDFVINNAAAARGVDRVPVIDMPIDAWDTVIRVNLRGTFLMSKVFGRHLIDAGGGAIVNISSIAGKMMSANTSAYASSKAAIHALTSSMSQEVGQFGVRVNVICPGLVDTSRIDDMRVSNTIDMATERIPLRRMGSGEEIAWATIYLCSDQGSWITGQAINVDGGMAGMR
ncbi:MAG TPA: SDR family NAD(P)-dependent oxidoreductase [Tepidiformaceae bacterium]|nr:SDR family NAD(P)-dependent oxidoreductase [Tepidiformaceae bacterium]